jgi:tetratricopeptide (TPR) repeat protein
VIAPRVGALVVAAGALFSAGVGGATLDRLASLEQGERPLLYLPNGKHLRAASLGNAPLVADVVYLWAIQYYSDYRRADRYRFVEHIFGNVIAELDPHYEDPYSLGALILIVEAHDLDAGLRLLDEGFSKNPDAWILPYLAGWECERAQRYDAAADYFQRSARAPTAPAFVARMRAGMFAKAGDLDEASRAWQQILDDAHSDAASREIASRQLRAIDARRQLDVVQAALDSYRAEVGRNPARLEDLVASGRLATLPSDPDGNPLRYDATAGRVSLVAGGILGAR